MANRRGFTLIELLVVVAIISLLSSIVLAAVESAYRRALIASIVADFAEVEKSFKALLVDEGVAEWWHEANFGFGANPEIAELVTQPDRLGQFLTRPPNLPEGNPMIYDNDRDTFTCGDQVYRGVNLIILGISQGIATDVNELVDGDGDLSCGKVRWTSSNGTLIYMIRDRYNRL